MSEKPLVHAFVPTTYTYSVPIHYAYIMLHINERSNNYTLSARKQIGSDDVIYKYIIYYLPTYSMFDYYIILL